MTAVEASMPDPRSSVAIETPGQAEKMAKRWADSRIVDHLTVEELVSKITPENKHDYSDTDFGKPVGKEKL